MSEFYRPDRRANRLVDWTFEQVGREWFVLLRGSDEVTKHVLASWPGARQVERRERHRPRWTHRLLLPESPTQEMCDLMNLLQRVLVLCVRDVIDGAVALDFYTRPCATDPEKLDYTGTAKLIRTIKSYASVGRDQISTAGLELCGSLCDVVRAHPWLCSATRILPAPGHDRRIASASVRIGQTLSRDLGVRRVVVGARNEYRRSAKEMSPEERAVLIDEFFIEEDLSDHTVLIVDDLYQTGCTMAGVAKAARQAGAVSVLGIVAARTIRLN